MSTVRMGKYEARVKNEKGYSGAGNGKNGTVPLRVTAGHRVWQTESCLCVPLRAMSGRTGAIMHSGAIFLKSQVRIEGASKVYARNADSGYEVRFHFCPNCGSNTYYEFDRSPDECGVPVGAFADPNFIRPAMSNNGRVLRRSKIRRAMSFWVNSRHRSTSASCPLYPQKRTSSV